MSLAIGLGNAGFVVGHLQYGQAGVQVGVQRQFDAAIGMPLGVVARPQGHAVGTAP